ncbi:hypothetical protein F5Y06DRAFT_175845 [Hypoxylon sp. FL0890]|nr:hypothetical protein F5Y06DRAFT_175845 [Hypoxylon sp. FL0890]
MRSMSIHGVLSLRSSNMALTDTRPGWPPQKLPVELFMEIAQHLPSRRDLESMRLVNREFNSKMICFFIRQVVIHLGPELSTKLDTGLALEDGSTFIDVTGRLLSSDVFRNFGPDICRLGLALELDEYELATPSTGDLEEIYLPSWGIYRWPTQISNYDPSSQLEKVTRSLEKSQGVFRLLTSVNNVHELALSCDACLGYLQGPDVNRLQPPGRPPVFGDPNQAQTANPQSLQVRFDKPYKLEMLERKLAAAGVPPLQFPVMIAQLCDLEHTSIKDLTYEVRSRTPLPSGHPNSSNKCRDFAYDNQIRLQPDQLTDTQKRFLFHHLSAHQALIQSFLIAVVDNGPSFTHLTKLNIARLPSFYVEFLCNDNFWSALPGLEEVALGVIPDWRELFQQDLYTVSDRQVYPTDALPKVFDLLNNYVCKQPRIKRLHFEWHCGGELAAGCIQRNKYVLPAPFLKSHRKVVNSSMENLLILPFIKHLSLKNCWFTPNVFYRIMDTMAREHSLEELELETVSLSGPPIHRQEMKDTEDFPPLPRTPQNAQQFNLPPGPLPPLQNEDLDNVDKYPLREPPWLSWCHIIDMLTPGVTIKESVHKQNSDPLTPRLRIIKDLKLRKIVFKSCGYVDVPDRRFISIRRVQYLQAPAHIVNLAQATVRSLKPTRDELYPFLQVSTDRHLGRICLLIDLWEKSIMRRVWGFHFGWVGTYDERVIRAAYLDGVFAPGFGRFSGTLDRDSNPSPKMRRYPISGRAILEEAPVPYVFDTSLFDRDYVDEGDRAHSLMLSMALLNDYQPDQTLAEDHLDEL